MPTLTDLARLAEWNGKTLLVAIGLAGFYGLLCFLGKALTAFWDEVAR